MANFTAEEVNAILEVLLAMFAMPIADPVPTQKMVYYFAIGYMDARQGNESNPNFTDSDRFCDAFCCCYTKGYIAGTT